MNPHSLRLIYAIGYFLFGYGWEDLCAQSYFNQIKGARLNALANQGTAVKGQENWMINPASLGFDPATSVIISGESRFVGTGIRGSSFNSTLSLNRSGGIALGVEFYGLPEYQQQGFRFGYGRLLSKRISLGGTLQYIRFIHLTTESTSLQVFTLGILYDINNQLGIGTSINFPFTPVPVKDPYSHPSFNLGLRYSVSDPVHFYAEASREYIYGLNFKLAMEYELIQDLTLRIGVSTMTHAFSTGFSVELQKKWSIDAASVFYQGLGMTPSLSIKYTFDAPQKKEE